MSKHLFSFLLSELKTIRVICKKQSCGAILEVPNFFLAEFASGSV